MLTRLPVEVEALLLADDPPPRSLTRFCRNPTRVGALAEEELPAGESALTRFVKACCSCVRAESALGAEDPDDDEEPDDEVDVVEAGEVDGVDDEVDDEEADVAAFRLVIRLLSLSIIELPPP